MSICVIGKFPIRSSSQNCLVEVPSWTPHNFHIYYSTTSMELTKGAVTSRDSCPQSIGVLIPAHNFSVVLCFKNSTTQWLLHPTHKTRYLSMQWYTWKSTPAEFRWYNPNLFEVAFGGKKYLATRSCSLIWNKYLEQQQRQNKRTADMNPRIYVAVGLYNLYMLVYVTT